VGTDWSSDVCPSDLGEHELAGKHTQRQERRHQHDRSRGREGDRLLPPAEGSPHQGSPTVRPAVPAQSSAARLIPRRTPASSVSVVSGGGGSSTQSAPTSPLLSA